MTYEVSGKVLLPRPWFPFP